MLKTIPPIIGSELLAILAEMGHGDELVLADRNFPAVSTARATV
ncbi:MAG: ribose ABC transporter, partial [Brevundimonas sp.]